MHKDCRDGVSGKKRWSKTCFLVRHLHHRHGLKITSDAGGQKMVFFAYQCHHHHRQTPPPSPQSLKLPITPASGRKGATGGAKTSKTCPPTSKNSRKIPTLPVSTHNSTISQKKIPCTLCWRKVPAWWWCKGFLKFAHEKEKRGRDGWTVVGWHHKKRRRRRNKLQ